MRPKVYRRASAGESWPCVTGIRLAVDAFPVGPLEFDSFACCMGFAGVSMTRCRWQTEFLAPGY